MKKILVLMGACMLYLLLTNERKPRPNDQSVEQAVTLHSLHYTKEDIEILNQSFSKTGLRAIIAGQIYREHLLPYLNHPYFDISFYLDYELTRKKYAISHFEAVNYTHRPPKTNWNLHSQIQPKEALFKDTPLVLVNKEYALNSSDVPHDLVLMDDLNLVIPGDLDRNKLQREAYLHLKELFISGLNEGLMLFVSSAYRSYERQVTVYNQLMLEDYNNAMLSAKPGHSEHQTGLAVDVTCKKVGFYLDDRFELTKESEFLSSHASHYGFIIRYPKEKSHLTGYLYEPWHLRYVGKEVAQIIEEEGLTLEAYILKYIPLEKPETEEQNSYHD